MKFTIPALVTVEVTDLHALTAAAAHSFLTRDHAPGERPPVGAGTEESMAVQALSELAYPPTLIDGYPGIEVVTFVVGAVLPHEDR